MGFKGSTLYRHVFVMNRACAPSEDSDLPVYPCSLIRMCIPKDSKRLQADRNYSDQPERIRILIEFFVGRTCSLVGNSVSWIKLEYLRILRQHSVNTTHWHLALPSLGQLLAVLGYPQQNLCHQWKTGERITAIRENDVKVILTQEAYNY